MIGKEQVADHARDWMTWGLAGLGVTLAAHEWVGGILLAMAGATFAMKAEPEKDRRELWAVIGGAFFVAHLAALVAIRYAPDLPVQVVMALAGFFSRFVIRFALRLAGVVEGKADRIAERAIDRVLPGDDR